MDVVLAFKRLFFYNPSPKTDQTGHTGPAEASMFPWRSTLLSFHKREAIWTLAGW